ncbi:MAG: hypothetical protein JWP88_169 [Flaviaesturariibacter sp.]|nr:hypothetical protein [Flaviaesturariibacter sp.]
MKEGKDEFEGNHYQNGQSDVEKLMREHLQTGREITDEELKNVKVGVSQDPQLRTDDTTDEDGDRDGGFGEKQEGHTKGSTWDVVDE